MAPDLVPHPCGARDQAPRSSKQRQHPGARERYFEAEVVRLGLQAHEVAQAQAEGQIPRVLLIGL